MAHPHKKIYRDLVRAMLPEEEYEAIPNRLLERSLAAAAAKHVFE